MTYIKKKKKKEKGVHDPNKATSGKYWLHGIEPFVLMLDIANWMDVNLS